MTPGGDIRPAGHISHRASIPVEEGRRPMAICNSARRLAAGLTLAAGVAAWPVPAGADYFVPVATVDQGETSRANDGDGLCNLAEAIDAVNRGVDLHGCVNDGLGDGHGIWLDTSMVLVNGQWMPPVYRL